MYSQSSGISRTSHIYGGTAQKLEHVKRNDFIQMFEYELEE